jgi:HEAT repeat protein
MNAIPGTRFALLALACAASTNIHFLPQRARAEEPKPLNIAEFSSGHAILGGDANEARLKRIIRETVKPKSANKRPIPAEVERLLSWSEPVDGLSARIEDVVDWPPIIAIVRIKNTSQQPLVVPSGNPRHNNVAQAFEIYVRQGSGPWQRADWAWDAYCEQPEPHEKKTRQYQAGGIRGLEADRPMVTLRPGEHCLAYVTGHRKQDNGQPKEYKVVLRQPAAHAEGQWSGVLETPARPARNRFGLPNSLAGALPMPEHFPTFTYAFTGISWSGQESAVKALLYSNHELVELLRIYDPAAVCKELEKRLRAEKRMPVKLFLATVAARAGSEQAALFILEAMKDTEYRTVLNVHGALEGLFPFPRTEVSAWVVELSMSALNDGRLVTGLEKTNWARGASFPVGACETDGLEFALGDAKCRQAVPLFIERVKNGQAGWYTFAALGDLGDERAIPALMHFVESNAKQAKNEAEGGGGHFFNAAHSLSKLRAKEAVPLLLQYVEFPEIIRDLGEIGDRRAVPVLEALVVSRGMIKREGTEPDPEGDAKRFITARLALAGFDSDNGVKRLGEMLADETLDEQQRYDVVLELGRRPDPKAVPLLINVIKKEQFHYTVSMAISDLARYKYRATIEGLIECFDVKFKEEDYGKGQRATAEGYRNDIARSLQKLTGQPFGADKQQWLKWWQEKGSLSGEWK